MSLVPGRTCRHEGSDCLRAHACSGKGTRAKSDTAVEERRSLPATRPRRFGRRHSWQRLSRGDVESATAALQCLHNSNLRRTRLSFPCGEIPSVLRKQRLCRRGSTSAIPVASTAATLAGRHRSVARERPGRRSLRAPSNWALARLSRGICSETNRDAVMPAIEPPAQG